MVFMHKRRLVLASAVLALAGCAAQHVAAHSARVDLEVLDRQSGTVLQTHVRGGRTYVAGESGARYALRVTNRSPGRILVVLTVDGVNIVTGETGAWDQLGYVLDPWQTCDLSGWRKSDQEVAAFEFTALPRSYAARTGRPAHVGVIGMAVFAEKVRPVEPVAPPLASLPADSLARVADAPPAGAVAAAPPAAAEATQGARREADAASPSPRAGFRARALPSPQAKLGTGHGAREWSVTRRVEFERDTREPFMVASIEYDAFDNLVAAGIIPVRRASPLPFPGSTTNGYVPDPPAFR